MVKFCKGSIVKNANTLKEGFRLLSNKIEALVDNDKILRLFFDFVDKEKDNTFFLFLEMPCSLEDEIKIKDKTKLHFNVYYLDGINRTKVKEIFNKFKDVFLNEGICQFGIGSRYAEIGKYKYNMIELFYKKQDIHKYKKLFEDNNILENNNLITPWDTFDGNNPGDSLSYTDAEGNDFTTILNHLTTIGLYKSEVR